MSAAVALLGMTGWFMGCAGEGGDAGGADNGGAATDEGGGETSEAGSAEPAGSDTE